MYEEENEDLSYGEFALYYDQLMGDAPYDRWMTFFETAVARYGIEPRHIADLGCGTGTISWMLQERGYKVTGVDLSEDMLAIAQSKGEPSNRLRFLCQDLRELRLPEPCDLALSFCDSFNYLTEEADVQQSFARVKKALRDGGVFLFDLHSPYKLREKLGDHVFYEVGEDVSYIWQSRFDPERVSVEYDITFFARAEEEEEELYRRFQEVHVQRAYEPELITEWLISAGFQTVEVYADYAWDVPNETSERLFFVAK